MALSVMTWDELNQLVGYKKSEPFDEYFEPMQISQKQKAQRKRLAGYLDDVFVGLLAELFYIEQMNAILSSDIYERTRQEYLQAVEKVGIVPDEYIIAHGMSVITNAVQVLYRHKDDPYYYSHDRAMALSENEANSVFNYTEYEDIVKSGKYKYKTWNTIMDGRERDSHAEVNGLTIGIYDVFHLQGGDCYRPKDDSLGMSDEEIISCRCSLSFS